MSEEAPHPNGSQGIQILPLPYPDAAWSEAMD